MSSDSVYDWLASNGYMWWSTPESRRRTISEHLNKLKRSQGGLVTQQPTPPIPGLCAICAYRATEFNGMDVKEPPGGPHGPGWRTVEGAEIHQILHTWSRAGDRIWLEGARVTDPSLPDGMEYLPMLPVTEIGGVPACAAHVGCLLPRGETR